MNTPHSHHINNITTIAEEHIRKKNEHSSLSSDYYYVLDDQPIDFIDRYFFSYIIRSKQEIPSKEPGNVGGYVGYTILKESGQVESVSLIQFDIMKEIKRLVDRLDEHLNPDNQEVVNLTSLKNITDLNAGELLPFKKKATAGNMADKAEREALIEEIVRYWSRP